MNVNEWFTDPFRIRQLVSWSLLTISLVLIITGVWMFNKHGKIDQNREDESLVGIEKTSQLVTTGIYHYIRHPFYSSLLFLGWGIFLKNLTWLGLLLAFMNTILLCITARREETENIDFFGESYQFFMQETKMFIPFLF
jgi:protein-S-isoprenylcysteine O-methyltransferase Ste14